MELTLGGLVGATLGAALGAANFIFLIAPMVNEKLNAAALRTNASREETAERISAARRAILAFNMLVFMGAGYWAGTVLAH